MNLDRYEKIDGWQALERLKNNETVTREIDGMYFDFERTADSVFETELGESDFDMSDIVLNEFLESNWYIKKPFDVRQAMLERPNEWVGAYQAAIGHWNKVGFCTKRMGVVLTTIDDEISVRQAGVTSYTNGLDECIPIEDVPEEAAR